MNEHSMLLYFVLLTVVLALPLITHRMRAERSASEQFNSLAGAVLAAAVLPFLFFLPSLPLQLLPHGSTTFPALLAEPVASLSAMLSSVSPYLLWLYLAGLVVQLLRLIHAHFLVSRWISRGETNLKRHYEANAVHSVYEQLKANDLGAVRVVAHPALQSPMTVGYVRKHLLLPASFFSASAQYRAAAVQHEMVHMLRSDWLLQCAFQIIFALLWFHPLVYPLKARLSHTAECATDDQVLLDGFVPDEYAESLLCTAVGLPSNGESPVPAFAWKGPRFADRVRAVIDARPRQRSSRSRTIESLGLYLLLLVPILTIKAAEMPAPYKPEHALKVVAIEPLQEQSDWFWLICDFGPAEPVMSSPAVEKAPTFFHDSDVAWAHSATTMQTPPNPSLVLSLSAKPTPMISVRGMVPRRSVSPVYPEKALRRGIEGYVVVRFDINEKGGTENATVIDAKPKGLFERSVLKALAGFEYQREELKAAARIKGVVDRFVFQLIDTESGEGAHDDLDNEKKHKNTPTTGSTMIAQGAKPYVY